MVTGGAALVLSNRSSPLLLALAISGYLARIAAEAKWELPYLLIESAAFRWVSTEAATPLVAALALDDLRESVHGTYNAIARLPGVPSSFIAGILGKGTGM